MSIGIDDAKTGTKTDVNGNTGARRAPLREPRAVTVFILFHKIFFFHNTHDSIDEICCMSQDFSYRKQIRLKYYDYTQHGAYFVTICTYGRVCLFGSIVNKAMQLNACGKIVLEEWIKSASIRREIELGTFVIMPNHLHGIVMLSRQSVGVDGVDPCPQKINPSLINKDIDDANTRSNTGPNAGANAKTGARRAPLRKPRSLSSFIAGFKSAVTKRINETRTAPDRIWQRNYYEHIIRTEFDYERISEYIVFNPESWAEDVEYHDKFKLK